MNPNSTYVPRNRLSRYLTALSSLALVRFKSALGSELPLDKIGLFANASFCWLGEYLRAGYRNGMRDKILPSLANSETCGVNGPRLEALLHAQFVRRGQSGASVPRVVWNFVRTRVLVTLLIYVVGMAVSLIGPMFILSELLSAKNGTVQTECFNETIIGFPLVAFGAMPITTTTTTTTTAMPTTTSTEGITSTTETSTVPESPARLNSNGSDLTIDHQADFDEYGESEQSAGGLNVESKFTTLTQIGLIVAVQALSQFLIAWSSALSLRTAIRVRTGCLSVAYRRILSSSLRTSSSAHQSESLQELVSHGPLVLVGPLTLVLVTGYAWFYFGHWHAIGVLLVVAIYLGAMVAAYLTQGFAIKAIDYALRKMSVLEEFISNIHLAKMTQWDRHFQDKIEEIRRKELTEIQFGGFSEGCGLCLVHIIPIFTISAIVIIGLAISAEQIDFRQYAPIFALFFINLKECIRVSWIALGSIFRGKAFLDKLKTVLILQETNRYVNKPIDRSYAVVISNGYFTWSRNKPKTIKSPKRLSRFYVEGYCNGNYINFNFPMPSYATLNEINFALPKGKIVGICGGENSGKSSLILSILGHLDCINGSIAIDGKLSHVPEEPWLMDGTIRDNILFGETYDSTRYYRVVRSAHLNSEMSSLPELDDTEVQVANLDRIQRQKLVLARAVYTQRDIYLLDNPLAELPDQDCLHIFEKSVLQLLAGKSVVLVTDRAELLERCHVVYVMQEGRIVESGSHDELLQCESRYKLLHSTVRSRPAQPMLKSRDLPSPSPSRLTPTSPRDFLSSIATSVDSIENNNEDDPACPLYWRNLEFPLLQHFNHGRLDSSPRVYLRYTGGWSICIVISILTACYSLLIAAAPLSVVYVGTTYAAEFKTAVVMLLTLVVFSIICGVILTIAYNKTAFVAASRMHDFWMENLGSMQISIFNSSTIPLLLNICSLNIQEVDFVLPKSIITIIVHVGISLFSTIVLGHLSTLFLLPIAVYIFLSVIYTFYVKRSVLCFHELKVCSSIFVLNQIASTIQGRATIQAFHKEKEFLKKFYKIFNEKALYNFMRYSTKLWLEFRIKFLSVLILGAVILLNEIVTTFYGELMTTLIAYICTLQLIISVSYVTGTITYIWSSLMALNCVETYMKNIPKEREGTARIPDAWPGEGSVQFKNVLLQDREESSKKPLNFIVTSGEKIDIVLPQPDLKMAFISVMFRFTDPPSGRILIGNSDITDVALDRLRRCICFVPADPTLFSGSIRHNLDPAAKLSDQYLMSALQRVYLWDKVSRLPDKMLSDSSHLFTVCERILIFLTRAILNKRTKIILIEEPDIDLKDKAEILELVLRDVFSSCTVIRLISNSSQKSRSASRILFLEDDLQHVQMFYDQPVFNILPLNPKSQRRKQMHEASPLKTILQPRKGNTETI